MAIVFGPAGAVLGGVPGILEVRHADVVCSDAVVAGDATPVQAIPGWKGLFGWCSATPVARAVDGAHVH